MDESGNAEREYLSAVAHDLRAPLAAIHGFAVAIADGTAPTEKHAEYLAFIASESKRLADMVEGLFQLSVLENSPAEKKPFSISEVARIALLGISDRLDKKGVVPDVYVEDVTALGDRTATERAINNLLDNAAKFVPNGGKLWLRVYKSGKDACFELGNSGAPIPRETAARLFDKYVKTRGNGAGLGLCTVKAALVKQGSDIGFRSDADGTVFSFALPTV